MKNLITIISFFLALTLVNAQTPTTPAPPETPGTSISSSTSKKNIQIRENKDRKLNVKIDDDQFNMKITFPKKYRKEFRKDFLATFKNSGDNYIWNGEDAETKVKIRSNKINIKFLKASITNEELSQIKTFAEGVLDQLDWNVENLGL